MFDIDDAEILDLPQAEFDRLIEIAKQLKAARTQEDANGATDRGESQ